MNNILLIDGNSMLFRAYYATKYNGAMKTSTGIATNAVFGFSTMLAKALQMFEPTHILIAFDTSQKTFRHKKYSEYKGTRSDLDPDLIFQFELVREFLDAYPITRLEVPGFEADDIIGSLSKEYQNDEVIILTSDKDMLQLIDVHTQVFLMKKGLSEIAIMNQESLHDEMGIIPSQIVDLKALMGDASDNIPGVPSIGEKTALKLLDKYQTLDGVYADKENIKGKMGEKIREFEDQAYLSYELATIDCDMKLNLDLSKIEFSLPDDTLNAFYRKYDMNSLIVDRFDHQEENHEILEGEALSESWLNQSISCIWDLDAKGILRGVGLAYTGHVHYIKVEDMDRSKLFEDIISSASKITAIHGKELVRYALEHYELTLHNVDDLILLAFIIDNNVTTFDKFKDFKNYWFHGLSEEQALLQAVVNLQDTFAQLIEQAKSDNVLSTYVDIEKPLIPVLARMEYIGIDVNPLVFETVEAKTALKLQDLTQQIYALSGLEFNINSPKKLGEVLFDHLGLPTKKKRSTAVDVLESLLGTHPIIPLILEYRKYQKLYSTYAVGLVKHISKDNKIHTRYNQHIAATGRLSSTDPNLQNISVKDEESREIRQAFTASEGHQLLMIDYSQIELRILSYLAQEQAMLDAFNQGKDIHQETAKAIFNQDSVSNSQRRQAKSVNFGIIYGMSEYGLSKQLDISIIEARNFIQRYHEIYPNISRYMDETIQLCQNQGYVTTLFGRRRYIPEIHEKNRAVAEFGKRAAMNAPIQGTAADLIKIAMIRCAQVLPEISRESEMILQVHDELIFNVLESDIELVSKSMIEIMETVVDWPVKLLVSSQVGMTWYDA